MYRALKSAQSDMNETLLKFADEVIQAVEAKASSGSHSGLENAIATMIKNQNIYFDNIAESINRLDATMVTILKALNTQSHPAVATATGVNTSHIIPSIQPTSSNTDLKDICVTNDISNVEYDEVAGDEVEVEEEVEEEEVEEEEVEEEEVEVEEEEVEVEEEEVEEEEVEEEEVEEAEEELEVEEAEEELEVEEWSYKGKLYFKDGENTVYVNDGGELGDPIGIYDPVKKIVKKLPSN